MKRKIFFGITLIVFSASVYVFAGRGQLLSFFKPAARALPQKAQAVPVAKNNNPKLISTLAKILGVFDANVRAYTLAGNINLLNKADTTEKMDHVNFLLVKSGESFYYKMGNTEALNQDGVYLNINGETKKVFITEKKQINTLKFIDPNQIKQLLQTEDYDLISRKEGGLITISLVNERHYTCKEYAVTYDTLNYKLTGIYYRLTYLREPMNKDKEKVINIRFKTCDTTANIGMYNDKSRILTQAGKLTAKYAGYELIHL